MRLKIVTYKNSHRRQLVIFNVIKIIIDRIQLFTTWEENFFSNIKNQTNSAEKSGRT